MFPVYFTNWDILDIQYLIVKAKAGLTSLCNRKPFSCSVVNEGLWDKQQCVVDIVLDFLIHLYWLQITMSNHLFSPLSSFFFNLVFISFSLSSSCFVFLCSLSLRNPLVHFLDLLGLHIEKVLVR